MALDPIIADLNLAEIVQPYTASLNTDIFPDDGMYVGDNRHHYFSCGASALTCILHNLGVSEIEKPQSILDFGCGAGRVTRWLRASFPEAIIHACDIREQDVKFVRQQFRATTWVSGIDIDALEPLSSYDVIWVGSVFTHLSAEVSTKLFDKLRKWLTPKGVLIFSVHGRVVLHRGNTGEFNYYGLGEQWGKLTDGYEKTGYGYADYPSQDGYGISVSKSTWWINLIEQRTGMRLVSLSERAWDQHHDVIAVQNANWEQKKDDHMALDPIIADLKLAEIVRPYTASLNTDISPDDGMYAGNRHHYFSCGASALTCILHSLGVSGIAKPNRILDFGCGAGRVTRWLRASFPDAIIHACDIREQDLKFVKESCRAETWVSGIDVDALEPLNSYDVIWVGSVFTHLSAAVSTKLFDKLMKWLTPKGVLIFSVHGRFVLHRASAGDNIYGLGENWGELTGEYEKTGYGYADYPSQDGYGISVSKSTWWINLIEQRTGIRLVSLGERAWDQHHDVLAVQNANWD
jgi:trans-aconitate methyltransferase